MAEIDYIMWNCSGVLPTDATNVKIDFSETTTRNKFDVLTLIETHHKDENNVAPLLLRYKSTHHMIHTLSVFSSFTHFSFFSFAFHNDTPTPIQTYFPIRRALERFQTVVNFSLSYANPLEFYKSLSHSLRIRYQNTFLFQNHPT